MKTLLVAVALMFTSCAGFWHVPDNVRHRRHATGIIKTCRGPNMGFGGRSFRRDPWLDQVCVAKSEAYCKSVGLEKSCGVDGMWTEYNGAK